MNPSSHTPTPWRMYLQGDSTSWRITPKPEGVPATGLGEIASIPNYGEESQANAAFIVRAVNAHDSLVEALRNVVAAFGGDMDWWNNEGLSRHESTGKTSEEIRQEVLEEARAALKKVGA